MDIIDVLISMDIHGIRGFHRIHGIRLKSVYCQFGTTLGSVWSKFVVCNQLGVSLVSVWANWDQFGMSLGSLWDQFGMIS